MSIAIPEAGRDDQWLTEDIAERLTGRDGTPTGDSDTGIFPPSGEKAGGVGGE